MVTLLSRPQQAVGEAPAGTFAPFYAENAGLAKILPPWWVAIGGFFQYNKRNIKRYATKSRFSSYLYIENGCGGIKPMKKFLSVVLALVLVVSTAVMAAAVTVETDAFIM